MSNKTVFAVLMATMIYTPTTFAAEVYRSILNERAGLFDVKEVSIELLSVEDLDVKPSYFKSLNSDCDKSQVKEFSDIYTSSSNTGVDSIIDGLGDLTLDQVINLGQKAWQFILDNRPVVNATRVSANALPRGLKCWDELENWQRPRSEVYRAVYKNGFGMEVVTLEFRLLYTYGGQVKGVGRYLANTTVQYKTLNVFWGFTLDANVEIPQVINLGTSANPIGGMQVSVLWTVKGLNHVQNSASFFVYGDGRKTDVLN
jgi:hypothetical protein